MGLRALLHDLGKTSVEHQADALRTQSETAGGDDLTALAPRHPACVCGTVRTVTPVSYTHLDVYKRQPSTRVAARSNRASASAISASGMFRAGNSRMTLSAAGTVSRCSA